MKFKLLFTFLLFIGAVIFGLNKDNISTNNPMTVNTKNTESFFPNSLIPLNKENSSTQIKNTISKKNNNSFITNDKHSVSKEERSNTLTEDSPIDRDSLEYVRSAMEDIQRSNTLLTNESQHRYIQDKKNKSIATIQTISRDNPLSSNERVIRNSDYNTESDITENEYSEDDVNMDDINVNDELEKDPSEINAKSNNTNVFPGYITGSAINNIEKNESNINRTTTGILIQNNVADTNRSIFPVNSIEALHDCYFDNNAKMQCKKSIINCEGNGELGLKCTDSYYVDGIWYSVPTPLTIQSNTTLVQKHLETKTTFALPKFTRAYYEERDLNSSLIRPDLNTSKNIKLKQFKQYIPEKTRLDRGVEKLFENNNTRTSTSIFVRGTRFGTGHEKVQGANSEILQALRDYLSQFSLSDDNDIYGVLDYWTLMDNSHKFGDDEDFALTAMEWLLINGVDPKYLTLTEIKTYEVDTTHIILVIQTEEPSQKLIVSDVDIVEIENMYPNGYESLLINSYQYVD